MRLLALALAASLALPAAAAAAKEPPCGTKEKPEWCASIDTGAVAVVTRGERREYATVGGSIEGPLPLGLAAFAQVDAFGVQDGASIGTASPDSFRVIKVNAGLGGDVGPLRFNARGGVTYSIEGDVGAPIDPRQWDALVEAQLRLQEGGRISLRGGHDGAVGGWALVGDVEIPVAGGPAIVARYEFPLRRDDLGRNPWVLTAGGRVRIKSFRLALP